MKGKRGALYEHLPESPGVYLMRGLRGKLLYVGKAGNLRRRVSSYFLRPHDARIETLISRVRRIDYRETRTGLEALMLEAQLIRKYRPLFNIREKDDKSFLFVEVTAEEWPRVLLVRGKTRSQGRRFGPFTSASSIREALRILRRIFPWSMHPSYDVGKASRPCFDVEMGLCPGVCVGRADRHEYLENLRHLRRVLSGKTQEVIRSLTAEMERASRELAFERAAKLRRQIVALRHVQDVALLGEPDLLRGKEQGKRIEGYDVSNISGTAAVGSMAVFVDDKPDKDSYRRFRIRTIRGQNDVGMLVEVLRRRFHRQGAGGWPLPHCILVDGGVQQVAAAEHVLEEFGLRISVVGIAKGPKRKKNEFFGKIPEGVEKNALIRLRNEAHRFAIRYHRVRRSRESFSG